MKINKSQHLTTQTAEVEGFCGTTIPTSAQNATAVDTNQTIADILNIDMPANVGELIGSNVATPAQTNAPVSQVPTQSVADILLNKDKPVDLGSNQEKLENYFSETQSFLMAAMIANPEEVYGRLNQVGASLVMLGSDVIEEMGDNFDQRIYKGLQERSKELGSQLTMSPAEEYEMQITEFILMIKDSAVLGGTIDALEPRARALEGLASNLEQKLEELKNSSEEFSPLDRGMNIEIALLETLLAQPRM